MVQVKSVSDIYSPRRGSPPFNGTCQLRPAGSQPVPVSGIQFFVRKLDFATQVQKTNALLT